MYILETAPPCTENREFSEVLYDGHEIVAHNMDRTRRSSEDGFNVDQLPKANLTLGEFADQDPNVNIQRGFTNAGPLMFLIIFVSFAILISIFCWRYFNLKKLFSFYIFSNIF